MSCYLGKRILVNVMSVEENIPYMEISRNSIYKRYVDIEFIKFGSMYLCWNGIKLYLNKYKMEDDEMILKEYELTQKYKNIIQKRQLKNLNSKSVFELRKNSLNTGVCVLINDGEIVGTERN